MRIYTYIHIYYALYLASPVSSVPKCGEELTMCNPGFDWKSKISRRQASGSGSGLSIPRVYPGRDKVHALPFRWSIYLSYRNNRSRTSFLDCHREPPTMSATHSVRKENKRKRISGVRMACPCPHIYLSTYVAPSGTLYVYTQVYIRTSNLTASRRA